MSRDLLTTVIVIGLAVYGVYIGSYIPPMLVGSPPVGILVGFVVQAISAIVAAVGVWQHRSWAAMVILILGAAIVVTAVIEGFVLGIVSFNHAVAVAVVGALLSIAIAVYVNPRALRV